MKTESAEPNAGTLDTAPGVRPSPGAAALISRVALAGSGTLAVSNVAAPGDAAPYTDLQHPGLHRPTPAWLCRAMALCRNPVGVELSSVHLPRVASPSFVNPLRQKRYGGQESTPEGRQPWALMRNPVGIGFGNATVEIQQSAFPNGKMCRRCSGDGRSPTRNRGVPAVSRYAPFFPSVFLF